MSAPHSHQLLRDAGVENGLDSALGVVVFVGVSRREFFQIEDDRGVVLPGQVQQIPQGRDALISGFLSIQL